MGNMSRGYTLHEKYPIVLLPMVEEEGKIAKMGPSSKKV